MNHPRLYYLDDIPTPYRLGVLRRVAANWPGQFKLAFCAAAEPGRDWSFDFSDLDVEILPGRQFRPIRQVNPMSVKWNPTVTASLASFRPDVVVLSGYVHPSIYMAARWCRSNGVPYGLASESSLRNTTVTGLKSHLKRHIAGPLVRGMAFGLPVGREAGDYLRMLGQTNVPMHAFPNSPDTSAIVAVASEALKPANEAELRRKLGIHKGTRIVLFIGRMIEAKRPLDLVEAFKRVDASALDATLVIVGDGPLLREIKAAAGTDPRIVFTGWLTDPSLIAGLMAISAMMVLPSQLETWGAVVNESMAAGTPVVASDRVGSAVELIVHGRNGLIFPVGDLSALAASIAHLLGDESNRKRMAREARETAISQGHEFAAANLISAALAAVRGQG